MVAIPKQFEVYLVCLDPTIGFEIKKTRPCVIISPNEMNKYIKTVIIAPMTTAKRNYPTRVNLTFKGKEAQVVLDQIRTIDKSRLINKLGKLPEEIGNQVVDTLVEMFSRD
ncbi:MULTISPECIES: type II toxin-antitoxin system PemK/MazF family toxin [Moorena]|uniref:mRNA interferase n=1 Tax=Moorena producens 3L TaxID=489825 RepID=F4XSX4_9CYAN|nr:MULTISPECIES: type II toxin-antitoxin system PemK/MazF family toxin [Moorena]EGJ32314.1 transcriptional modulator of MazE/toxin, MazF [Moorena producens 3L]NEP65944.1 type II toxin-antitoxin system PemK/MazF family toxin [Moorena sp. SIO3A5]OLT67469.1 transcriptional regulator [Moorena producens 3L]